MEVVHLRFEAMRCHIAATRSTDLDERERLYLQGIIYSAVADQLEADLSPQLRQGFKQ